MAKSDSTRKPKLPKVWLTFLDGSIQPWNWHAKKPSNENGLVSRLYAPLQKPRRCVWQVQGGDWLSPHGRIALYLPKFCEDCGGKIARKR